MYQILVPLVLLCNGLAAGVLVGTLLGGVPLLLALPDDRYVHAHAFFASRFDPFMPACFVLTLLGDITLASGAIAAGGTGARVLFGLAAALALAAMVISLLKNVPINKYVQDLDPERLPGDFAATDPRYAWRTWNLVRSVLAVLSLVANCVALGVLL